MMNDEQRRPDYKKVAFFLLLAFGISWCSVALMHLAGIRFGSLLSIVIIALFYMGAPAIATLIIQKGVYKQSLASYGWTWKGKSWRGIFISLLLPVLFVLATLAVIPVLSEVAGEGNGFGQVDFSKEALNQKLGEVLSQAADGAEGEELAEKISENPLPFSGWALLLLTIGAAVLAAVTVNLPFMFGEEFGWRGLMLRELQPLGFFRGNLIIGIVWGLWHAPLIMLGHNYPGTPWAGLGMMVLFTTCLSFPMAWSRFRSGNILGPCLIHGMINGMAGGVAMLIHDSQPLFGSIQGLAGCVAITLVTFGLLLVDRSFMKHYREHL